MKDCVTEDVVLEDVRELAETHLGVEVPELCSAQLSSALKELNPCDPKKG